MIAIAKYTVSGTTIREVRFSSDIVHRKEVDTGLPVREAALRYSEISSSLDGTKREFVVLNNKPQGEGIRGLDETSGVNCASLMDPPEPGDEPKAHDRKLSEEDKTELCKVRPAAHRVGQTSFFGNI